MRRRSLLKAIAGVPLAGFAAAQTTLAETEDRVNLAGQWAFRLDPEGRGVAEQWYSAALPDRVRLPGSLQEQGFGNDVTAETRWWPGGPAAPPRGSAGGYPNWYTHPMYAKYREPGHVRFPIWLQPERHYIGQAWYQREIEIPAAWRGRRVDLTLERCHWQTTVFLDGSEIGSQRSLGAPHLYDLSNVAPGRHRLTILVDNGPIVDVGRSAHSVSDQTQTAWNGIVGEISLVARDAVWIDDVQIYPDLARRIARVRITVGNHSGERVSGQVRLAAQSYNAGTSHTPPEVAVPFTVGPEPGTPIEAELRLGDGMQTWDEFQPALYWLHARLDAGANGRYRDDAAASFGMREFTTDGTQFVVNGRKTILRGTVECCISPLTGYPATDVAAWRRIIDRAKDHGLNQFRFHSFFPPDAAFIAADQAGFYLQPEVHVWTGVRTEEQKQFLVDESALLLRQYGNHASFCMLGLGNESSVTPEINGLLIGEWQKDRRRVYSGLANANGSMIPEYDYYVAVHLNEQRVRIQYGWPPQPDGSTIVTSPPQTMGDWREGARLYDKPLVSHEAVQRCSYPDLRQAAKYVGSLKAGYLDIARDQLEERGMLDQAADFVRVSGKWQVQQFKEEIEAALRTPDFGGFNLLQLHDFTGQGAALVGVVDAFWEGKGYCEPEEFRHFCAPTVPLARIPRRLLTTADALTATFEVAHFGPAPLPRTAAVVRVLDERQREVYRDVLPAREIPIGNGIALGDLRVSVAGWRAPGRYTLMVDLQAAGARNEWDVWVFPATVPEPPSGTTVVRQMTDAVIGEVEAGASVLLVAPIDTVKGDIPQCFTSIYWNAPFTRGGETHTLGVLCDPQHALFDEFPTEEHTNWHWHELLVTARPMIFDGWGVAAPWPKRFRPLVQLIDDWNLNRKLGVVAEARLGEGRIVLCSMDLDSNLDQRPVARQFRASLLAYMASSQFAPTTEVSADLVKAVFL